jgi:hypothetical protein
VLPAERPMYLCIVNTKLLVLVTIVVIADPPEVADKVNVDVPLVAIMKYVVPVITPGNGVVTNVNPVVAPKVFVIEDPPEVAAKEKVVVPFVAEM